MVEAVRGSHRPAPDIFHLRSKHTKMLRIKKVTVQGSDFMIGSLNVRQYMALDEARVALYGINPTKEKYLETPGHKSAEMEAEFMVAPSLNNAIKAKAQDASGVTQSSDSAPLDPDAEKLWTKARVLDEMEWLIFRGLVMEILQLHGLKVEANPGEAKAAPAPAPALVTT
jgi:hypothetical protein